MKILGIVILVCFLLTAFAEYRLLKEYASDHFFDGFNFYSGDDPTHGFVNYVDQRTASSKGYASITSSNQVYIGVDHINNATGRGRDSVRLESKDLYTTGLFILDLEHMPHGCGVWPAFWTFGDNWPNNGEIDVIENVHEATVNLQTLHTSPGCDQSQESTSLFSGYWSNGANCDVYATGNSGCGIMGNADSYGEPFNNKKGGVYAMEWTNSKIQVFYFSRNQIPSNVYSASPDPSIWGKPVGYWTLSDSSCPASHFHAHKIVFNVAFCGDWAGATFSQACPMAQSCDDYVRYNPSSFQESFWLINSLKVYSN